MTVILGNADFDVREQVDPCINSLTILLSQIKYTKVHMATSWTIRHGLILFWFKDLMNGNKKLQFIDPTFRHSRLVPSSGVD